MDKNKLRDAASAILADHGIYASAWVYGMEQALEWAAAQERRQVGWRVALHYLDLVKEDILNRALNLTGRPIK